MTVPVLHPGDQGFHSLTAVYVKLGLVTEKERLQRLNVHRVHRYVQEFGPNAFVPDWDWDEGWAEDEDE